MTKILIIGSGPYGVGIANTLSEYKIPFSICGNTFDLWLEHTLSTMSIRSDWHTSEIYSSKNRFGMKKFIFDNYKDDAKEIIQNKIPINLFRNYLKYVQNNLDFPVKRKAVTGLSRKGNAFICEFSDGEIEEAERVVIATGIGLHVSIPEEIKKLNSKNIYHCYFVNDYEDLKNKKILIIGAGQSAGEGIVHLKKNNKITWVYKTKPVYYSEPLNLPTPVFKLILNISPFFYYLPDRMKKKFGKKYVISTITPDLQEELEAGDVEKVHIDANELELDNRGNKVVSKKLGKEFDAVISATGYRYHINNLKFLDNDIKKDIENRNGIPGLDYDFQTSIKNLYMVGGIAEPVYGPAQRFMMGARHAAKRILRALI